MRTTYSNLIVVISCLYEYREIRRKISPNLFIGKVYSYVVIWIFGLVAVKSGK